MSTPPYAYLDQAIQATTLIISYNNDSFFYPSVRNHTGYAADGFWYNAGVQDVTRIASWYSEAAGPFRGTSAAFPKSTLVILSRVSMVLLDETSRSLSLWMQFLLSDNFALTDNFSGALIGFLPSFIAYSDGVISITYKPDLGSVISTLAVVSFDFAKDKVYLDAAVQPS